MSRDVQTKWNLNIHWLPQLPEQSHGASLYYMETIKLGQPFYTPAQNGKLIKLMPALHTKVFLLNKNRMGVSVQSW